MYDRTFGPIMFDPLQSPSIDAIEAEGQGGGYETFTDEKKNFGSLEVRYDFGGIPIRLEIAFKSFRETVGFSIRVNIRVVLIRMETVRSIPGNSDLWMGRKTAVEIMSEGIFLKSISSLEKLPLLPLQIM